MEMAVARDTVEEHLFHDCIFIVVGFGALIATNTLCWCCNMYDTCTYTHTRFLFLSLCVSFSLSLSLSLSRSLFLTHTHSLTLTHTHYPHRPLSSCWRTSHIDPSQHPSSRLQAPCKLCTRSQVITPTRITAGACIHASMHYKVHVPGRIRLRHRRHPDRPGQ